jgi:hydroxyacylglutathione hydrolase
VPGHTLGHIAFVLAGHALVGDTLFAGGLRRLFEGTPEQMHGSLQRLATCPDATIVYPAHEYTLSNYRFLAAEAPDDGGSRGARRGARACARPGGPTVPTTMPRRRQQPVPARRDAAEFARLRRPRTASVKRGDA